MFNFALPAHRPTAVVTRSADTLLTSTTVRALDGGPCAGTWWRTWATTTNARCGRAVAADPTDDQAENEESQKGQFQPEYDPTPNGSEVDAED